MATIGGMIQMPARLNKPRPEMHPRGQILGSWQRRWRYECQHHVKVQRPEEIRGLHVPGPAAHVRSSASVTRCRRANAEDDYVQLLDWTVRQVADGKTGQIPDTIAPILQRLQLDRQGWCDLVAHFGRRFFVVAGAPTTIDDTTSRIHQHRYYVPSATRQLFEDVAAWTTSSA
jgi:hypothetical protein